MCVCGCVCVFVCVCVRVSACLCVCVSVCIHIALQYPSLEFLRCAYIYQGGLSEISTEETGSKSGQKFLITSDGRYFMKTITKYEAKFFRRVLPQYYKHMEVRRKRGGDT